MQIHIDFGLDSSHATAPDTARHEDAGLASVPAHSAAAAGLEVLLASPSQSDAASQGETVYDPFVGSATTPARPAQRPGDADKLRRTLGVQDSELSGYIPSEPVA
jgi:hypothetical protein